MLRFCIADAIHRFDDRLFVMKIAFYRICTKNRMDLFLANLAAEMFNFYFGHTMQADSFCGTMG